MARVVPGDTEGTAPDQQFRRRSRKFWVPAPCIPLVLAEVQRCVPLHQRGVTHSVYFDSARHELYHRRLVQQVFCSKVSTARWRRFDLSCGNGSSSRIEFTRMWKDWKMTESSTGPRIKVSL